MVCVDRVWDCGNVGMLCVCVCVCVCVSVCSVVCVVGM